MKLTIDTDAQTLVIEQGQRMQTLDLYSRESFEVISRQWVRVGWNQKYQYTFSWFGRPVIQLPEDLVRAQEVIFKVRPDVIIETGIAHGGSLIYYASLCKVLGVGRVVGIDMEIRKHNRQAIEQHELSDFITMIEGSSVEPSVVEKARCLVRSGEKVLVFLDSNHTKDHVALELEAYHPFVSVGSYIVATDGIMYDLADVPRGSPGWTTDNPRSAAKEFAEKHNDFVLEQPEWCFNESGLIENVTHWPGAWLRRVS
jgi:cephalosporin hydroxylase